METWDAIRARRDIRAYSDKALAKEDLHRVLEAGWRAPSANNRQRRDFVVSTDRSQLQELSKAWEWSGHVAGSAAAVTVVLPAPTEDWREYDLFDAGQAVAQMMVAAADLGIGSGHASIADKALVRRILGLPDDRDPVCFVTLGYPADKPLRPLERLHRRPFDEVVHAGHW